MRLSVVVLALLVLFLPSEFAKAQALVDISLAASDEPSLPGQPVTFTATITGSEGTPEGVVLFSVNGVAQATEPLSAGTATFVSSAFDSPGMYPVSADYSGDSTYQPGGASINHEVRKFTTSTALSADPSPARPGQLVTLTAEVSSSEIAETPTGEVTFFLDFVEQGSAPLVNGVAFLTISAPDQGEHQIAAGYGGAEFFDGSFGFGTLHVENLSVATEITVIATPSPSIFGEQVAFTATATAPGTGYVLQGEVEFTLDGEPEMVPLIDGVATLVKDDLAVGTHVVDVFAQNLTAEDAEGVNFRSARDGTVHSVTQPPQRSTVTTVNSDPNPSGLGEEAVFTATVKDAETGEPVSGSVVFRFAGQSWSTSLVGGDASVRTGDLDVGSYQVVAEYQGGNGYSASHGDTVHVVGEPDGISTQTTVQTDPSPSDAGSAFTILATVSSDLGGTPAGAVEFFIDGISQGSSNLAAGVASITVDGVSVGTRQILARYQGLDPHGASQGTVFHVVQKIPTTVGLSIEGSIEGQPSRMVATVSGNATGTVNFLVEGSQIGSAPILGGNATFVTSFAAGQYGITAVYEGDAIHDGNSVTVVHGVSANSFSTSTSVGTSPNPSAFGEGVTISVSVSSNTTFTMEGTVSLSIDGQTQPLTLVNGSASITTFGLSPGDHQIIASYGGSGDFSGSQGDTTHVVIAQRATTTQLTSDPNPSLAGQPVTVTASVISDGGEPTGEVSFTINGVPAETVPVTNGIASFTTAELAPGPYAIAATYSGDQSHSSSTAFTNHMVQTPILPSTTELTASTNPSVVGQAVTFSATVSGESNMPTGTVTITVVGLFSETVPLVDGVATYTTSALRFGSHTVVADYSGDSLYAASNASTGHVVANPVQATSVEIESSSNPGAVLEPVTFTASVTAAAGTPEGGLVSFFVNGIESARVQLVGGSAQFTTDQLAEGSHQIFATYAGTDGFLPGYSSMLVQQIDRNPGSIALDTIQERMTQLVSTTSGQAMSSAIDQSISDGFSQDFPPISADQQSMRFAFGPPSATRQQPGSSVLDGLAERRQGMSLRHAARQSSYAMIGKEPVGDLPAIEPDPTRWRLWSEVRNTAWLSRPNDHERMGDQLNVLSGIGYRLTPSLLIGGFGGYERFDYWSDAPDGTLEGDGWTAGAYLGWRPTDTLRLDAAFARSSLNYDLSSGAASGSFKAERWFAQTGVTGLMHVGGWRTEPSVRAFLLSEHQDGYVDSLNATHRAYNFTTVHVSAGAKASYPIEFGTDSLFSPYLGVFADYGATSGGRAGSSTDVSSNRFSARLTGGLNIRFDNAARLDFGLEYDGIGLDEQRASARARLGISF